MFQKSRHERLLLFLTLKPIVEDVNTGEISKCKGDTSPWPRRVYFISSKQNINNWIT